MKQVKIYCDKCGKEIPHSTGELTTRLNTKKSVKHYVVVGVKFFAGHFVDGNHTYPIDLCLDCTKQMLIDIVSDNGVNLPDSTQQ